MILTDGDTGETVKSRQFVTGENARTGLRGIIASEAVYVLPTITKPTVEVLEMFAKQPELEPPIYRELALINNNMPTANQPYTLEQFAGNNFRYVFPLRSHRNLKIVSGPRRDAA